jgi:hypothetical protein
MSVATPAILPDVLAALPSTSREIPGEYLLGHERFLPDPLEFIIRPALHNLDTDSAVTMTRGNIDGVESQTAVVG